MLRGKLQDESVSEKEEVAPTVKELLVSMSVDRDKINRICNHLIQLNKTGAITKSMLDDFEGFIVVKCKDKGDLKFEVYVELSEKFYKDTLNELTKNYSESLELFPDLEYAGELVKTVLEDIKVKELVEYISKIYTEWEWNVEGVFDVIENIRVSCNRDDYFAINIDKPELFIGLTIYSDKENYKEDYYQDYTKQHLDKAEEIITKSIKEFLDSSEITIDDITHNYSDSDIVYSSIVSPCIFTVKDLKIFSDRIVEDLLDMWSKNTNKSLCYNPITEYFNTFKVIKDNLSDSINKTSEAFSNLSASINMSKEELSRLKELSEQKSNPICEFVDDCDEDEWDAIILKDIITRYNDGEFLEHKEELSFIVLGLLCEDVDLESVGEIVEYMYNNYENNDIPDYAIEFARVVSQVMEALGGCED